MSFEEELLEAAKWVIMAYDQANTNNVIKKSGSRGEILDDAIQELRIYLVSKGIRIY